jgi:hypothetical protein
MSDEREMTEAEALSKSTGWINPPYREIGYLPFAAANFLVGTGRYEFVQAGCWGYVVRPK